MQINLLPTLSDLFPLKIPISTTPPRIVADLANIKGATPVVPTSVNPVQAAAPATGSGPSSRFSVKV